MIGLLELQLRLASIIEGFPGVPLTTRVHGPPSSRSFALCKRRLFLNLPPRAYPDQVVLMPLSPHRPGERPPTEIHPKVDS